MANNQSIYSSSLLQAHSSQEIQVLSSTKKYKHKIIAKSPKPYKSNRRRQTVQINLCDDQQNYQTHLDKNSYQVPCVVNLQEDDDQLDGDEIEYFKYKIGLKSSYKVSQNIKKNEGVYGGSNIPPPIKPIQVKKIYEYPSYVLGPNDTWPPKYPNSNRSFNKQMKFQRKLN